MDESTNLDELRDLTEVTGELLIHDIEAANLGFLSCLENVGTDLILIDNTAIESLEGLANLESIGQFDEDPELASGSLQVGQHPALVSLAGLHSLERVNRIALSSNDAMAELALDSLVQLHELHIGECFDEPYGNNGSLNGIVGIGSLMALREVAIYDQQSLVSLGDLLVLAEQGVSFETAVFGFNPMLPQAEILAFEEAATIDAVACQNLGDEEMCVCPGA